MHTNGPSASCPVCRKPLHELPEVSFLLRDAVSILFPEETRRRRDTRSKDVTVLESVSAGAEGAALAAIICAGHADVNASDDRERTALHLAAMSGYLAVCRALLDSSCFVEASACDVHGNTALHYAADGGHADICRAILKHKQFSEANAQNIFGLTALHCAKEAEVALVLLDSSRFACAGTTDMRGRTALHSAALGGHAAVCRTLLEHARFRNHIETKDSFNCTALDVASCEEVKQVLASVLGHHDDRQPSQQVRVIATSERLATRNVAFMASV